MGKASRIKQQSAREKIAAQREAARKAERRNRILITGGSTIVVLVIVLAFIIVKLSQGSPSSSGNSSSTGTALPASVTSQITGVPAATLDKVGKGVVPTFTRGQPPFTPGSGAALTSGGKPEMLYKSGYHSPYLAFTPVETTTVTKAPLQNPTSAQNAVWAKYEPNPQNRGYPFVAFSNKQVMKGYFYNPA